MVDDSSENDVWNDVIEDVGIDVIEDIGTDVIEDFGTDVIEDIGIDVDDSLVNDVKGDPLVKESRQMGSSNFENFSLKRQLWN